MTKNPEIRVGNLIKFVNKQPHTVDKIINPDFLRFLIKYKKIKQHKLVENFSSEYIQQITLSPEVHGLLLGECFIELDNKDLKRFSIILFGHSICVIDPSETKIIKV
jgi:hypothetical protein